MIYDLEYAARHLVLIGALPSVLSRNWGFRRQAYEVACNGSAPSSANTTSLVSLKVNSLQGPITIDDPAPHFSWVVSNPARGVAVDGYELEVIDRTTGKSVWSTGRVISNKTAYIPWGGAEAALVSDTVYDWVRGSLSSPSFFLSPASLAKWHA